MILFLSSKRIMLVISLPQFSRAASYHMCCSLILLPDVSLSHFTTQDFAPVLSTDLLHRRRSRHRHSPRTDSPRPRTDIPPTSEDWPWGWALPGTESPEIWRREGIVVQPGQRKREKWMMLSKREYNTICLLYFSRSWCLMLWQRQRQWDTQWPRPAPTHYWAALSAPLRSEN